MPNRAHSRSSSPLPARANAPVVDEMLTTLQRELRILAARTLRSSSGFDALHTATLVQETCLRLLAQRTLEPHNRAQFLGVAASLMRRVLVDHARHARRRKRQPLGLRLELADALESTHPRPALDVLEIHEALEQLEQLDATQARIVELRCFAGLDEGECAAALELPPRRVRDEWRAARAWLRVHLPAE